MTADDKAELRARLRSVLCDRFQTVQEIMTRAGINFLSPAKVGWHLCQITPELDWDIRDGRAVFRLPDRTDQRNNLTFFLE